MKPFDDPCARGVIRAAPCPREQGRELPRGRRRIILAACVAASSMAFIDGSALTMALPRLRAALGADLATVQWVVTGYLLALAALTLIGGALADAYGRARILWIGCLLFGAASIACALSTSAAALIAARTVQGIAAALLTPASLALIGATYAKDERAAAIGVWAAASALTSAAGPVLGGWLTQQFDWPAVFWINPPLAVIAMALLIRYAPAGRPEPRRFDIAGAAIIACGLAALTLALSQLGRAESAASFATGLAPSASLLLGLACIAGYALWERTTDHPLTPPRLLQNLDFVGLNVATLLIYGGTAILFFLLPFDLIDRRGLTPAAAGLAFLPFSLAVGLLSPLFGGLSGRLGARTMLIAGAVGAAAAYVWMLLAHDRGLMPGVIAPQALLGLSFAVLVAPLTASVMSSVPQTDEGLASGINNTAARIAQLTGVAAAAGLGALMSGFQAGLAAAAVLSAAGAVAAGRIRS
jgi:EmrB/QacA subfamily drug resistance transporter